MNTVSYEHILTSLRLLGIQRGDVLLVHSALTSIGYVQGGADAVIDALLHALGPEGTLVMSTLTGWDRPFDPQHSPSAVGAISEVFRRRDGVVRSLHPVHSVAALGKHAKSIVAGHEHCKTGCGPGTPYLKIAEFNGKIMMLGVDLDRNTMMHTLEELADVPYLLTVEIPAPIYAPYHGKGTFVLNKFPPGHRDFLRITTTLRERGVMTEGKIGHAVTKVLDAARFIQVGVEMLKQDPLYFICKNEHCNFCRYAHSLAGESVSIHSENHCCDPTCEICVIPN